jgi:glycosyltransferase involved in cell wall biosynthesis
MTPGDITVAVTVFDRRQYIEQAIASALAQTLPVRVMVVEDCGPDATIQTQVLARYGSRISYHRNQRRRGLFDNWNACIDLCATPWLCLLHDDDFLAPNFAETMVQLASKVPDKGLYFGRCHVVDTAGKVAWATAALPGSESRGVEPAEVAIHNPVCFPAELFRADYAKALGGFRPASLFTGDWDMWARLALHHGAAGTNRVIGSVRSHDTEGRGTTRVVRGGKSLALTLMQAKKNAAMLRRRGVEVQFDRASVLKTTAVSTRFLLDNAWSFSPRMLAYNHALLLQSHPPNSGHRLFQMLARGLGPGFLRSASRAQRMLKKLPGRNSSSRHGP